MARLGIEVNKGYTANRYAPHSRAGRSGRSARDLSALLESTQPASARTAPPFRPFVATLSLALATAGVTALAVWRLHEFLP